MFVISSVQRGLLIPEILLNILEFVGPRDFEQAQFPEETCEEGFEPVQKLISDWIDIWVSCRSVSRHWKGVIENERRFRKIPWYNSQVTGLNNPAVMWCYPAMEWLDRSLVRIGHHVSAATSNDYERLLDIFRRSILKDLMFTEPAVTMVMINFGYRSKYIQARFYQNPAFSIIQTGRHGQRRGFRINNPKGVTVKEVFEAIFTGISPSSNGYEGYRNPFKTETHGREGMGYGDNLGEQIAGLLQI